MFPRRAVVGLFVFSVLGMGMAAPSCPGNPNPGGLLPPVLSDPTLSGALTQGQPATLLLSVISTDPDGTVAIVTADLSALGGPVLELQVGSDGQTWSGSSMVTPPQSGVATVDFLATDNDSQTADIVDTIDVQPAPVANQPPQIAGAAVTGDLTVGQVSQVTVSANVTDADGTVRSVTADLSALGGGQVQLQASGDAWTFSGTVTPSASGTQTVTLVATDNDGSTTSVQAQIDVSPSPGSV